MRQIKFVPTEEVMEKYNHTLSFNNNDALTISRLGLINTLMCETPSESTLYKGSILRLSVIMRILAEDVRYSVEQQIFKQYKEKGSFHLYEFETEVPCYNLDDLIESQIEEANKFAILIKTKDYFEEKDHFEEKYEGVLEFVDAYISEAHDLAVSTLIEDLKDFIQEEDGNE